MTCVCTKKIRHGWNEYNKILVLREDQFYSKMLILIYHQKSDMIVFTFRTEPCISRAVTVMVLTVI